MRTLILVAVLLVAPSCAAEPWLQHAGDETRSSARGDAGPQALEVGLRIALPDRVDYGDNSIVALDGSLYLLLPRALVRVDLATGELFVLRGFGEADRPRDGWLMLSSDGRRFLVLANTTVSAYRGDGALEWSTRLPDVVPGGMTSSWCAPPAVARDAVFVGCNEYRETPGGVQSPVIFRVALGDGAVQWVAPLSRPTELRLSEPLRDRAGYVSVFSLALIGDRLIDSTLAVLDGQARGSFEGRDAVTGTRLWNISAIPEPTQLPAPDELEQPRADLTRNAQIFAPTGSDRRALIVLDTLRIVDVETGGMLAEYPFNGTLGADARALRGDDLYYGGRGEVRRLSLASGADEPLFRLRHRVVQDIVVGGEGWVYAIGRSETLSPSTGSQFLLANATSVASGVYGSSPDGAIAWSYDLPVGRTSRLALSDGLLAITVGAELLVFGRTPGAIQPAAVLSEAYPPVGSPVRIDARGTVAGAQAPDVELRVDWGDGTITEWSAPAVFEHAYARAGDHEATVQAQNSAGQISRTTVTVHVGGAAPRPPGLMETAFSSEYQNYTLFILGLLVTAAGGMFGIVRPRRRRARLRAALARVDDVFARTKGDAVLCEAALVGERKAARRLVLDGKLDEGQYALVAEHVGELIGRARLDLVSSRYRALPASVVEQLRSVLADGRVTAVERQHVETALLAADLDAAEREGLRHVVASWFEADAAR